VKTPTKWNIDLVKKYVEENGNGDELVSTEYNGANSKLIYKCHLCGKNYEAVWKSYHLGHRHQKCSSLIGGSKRKYSYEYVKAFIEENGYILVSENYIHSESLLNAICPKGHGCEILFSSFKSGRRCIKCKNEATGDRCRFTFEYVNNFILENGNGDELLSKSYKNNAEKLNFSCHICGEKYETSFDGFKMGYRCDSCSHKLGRKKQLDNVISEKYNFAYKYPEILKEWDWDKNEISPYKLTPASSYKAWWVCSECGLSYNTKISSRSGMNKTGCPYCKLSKGEIAIHKFLTNNNIKNIRQYKMDDCKDKRLLPFDYAVWINDELYLIEYQGSIHYEWKTGLMDENSFIIMQRHDKIKKEYCVTNNIKFIEIPYWDFKNIESILYKTLRLDNVETVRKEEF
jgi:DNA-directed RNA polymerase subunit RPC12/RpoP